VPFINNIMAFFTALLHKLLPSLAASTAVKQQAVNAAKNRAPVNVEQRAQQVADASAASSATINKPAKEAIDLSGLLVSGEKKKVVITSDLQNDFAVLQRAHEFVLVVSKDAHGTSRMFEMRTRARQALNIDQIELVIADSIDIIGLYKAMALPIRPPVIPGKPQQALIYTVPETMIEEMVMAADEAKSSDIHIESRVADCKILFRVNGFRQTYKTISHEEALSMGQVMYSVYADAGSKDSSWNPAEVCDGALEWSTKTGRQFQLRFSSSPIYPGGGFQIVLRMLQLSTGGGVNLDKVGYSEAQLEDIVATTTSRSGLVLLCGATNSGKSTSMQAMLRNVFAARGKSIKVITVEDPVEYVIDGACQIPIARRKIAGQDESDDPFTKALRGTLRQDPDLVMVGEIRDSKTAGVVQDLGLAGRKLMATLHTNSAIGAFTRLNKIGIDLDILTSPDFISGIIYQSLVPTLCQKCCVPWETADKSKMAPAFIRRVINSADVATVRLKGAGCNACKHSGIAGRTVCAEVLVPDRHLLKMILEKRTLDAETYWVETQGGVRIIEHAKAKMALGLVSPVDVEANIKNLSGADD